MGEKRVASVMTSLRKDIVVEKLQRLEKIPTESRSPNVTTQTYAKPPPRLVQSLTA
jgi:hypothetical protein